MLWPKKNSYKEFDNEKEFLRLENSQHPPPENFCLWNPKCGKIFLWNQESRALESGTWLKESGIPLTIGIQDLSSTDRESGI